MNIKRLYYFMSFVFASLYIFSANVFANVSIGSVVPQNTTSTPYTSQCSVAPYKYAIYEWQSFSLYHTHTPSDQAATWEYFGASNVVTYNYLNVIWNTINWNSLWWKFTDFTYNSNGRLWTAKFGGIWWWIQTSLAWEENTSNRAVKPSPNPNRANIVWQVVHILNRKQVSSRWGSYFSMTTYNFNTNSIYTKNADPNWYYGVEEDKKCQNFYVAKCWDWVRDNINKDWWTNTNGKQWIQTNDGFVTRVFPATVTVEQCDGSDWLTAWNTCNSQCQLVPIPQQADLSVTKTVNNSTPTVWSNVTFTMILSNAWPYTANNVTLTDILPSGYTYVSSWTSQWTYNFWNWIWNVGTINIGTTKTLTITATVKSAWNYINTIEVTSSDKSDPDSTPNNHNPLEDDQASATVTPVSPAPTCSITINPSNIVSGWLASVSRAITWSVNPSWIYVTPQVLWWWPHPVTSNAWTTNVAPTSPWVYTFFMTVTNTVGWLSWYCSATLTVWQPPIQNPILTIQKTLLVTKTYFSWDQIWFKINFQNNGSWTATQVVLTDILPSSLSYLTSAIFGIPNSNLTVTMSGANPIITYNGFNLAPWASGYMIITWVLLTNNAQNNRTNYTDILASNHPLVSATVLFSVWELPTNNVIFTKVWNKSSYQLWEAIQFTITATNQWPSPINDLTITDTRPIPACITYNTRSSPDWFTNPATMSRFRSWTLAVWQTATLTLNWNVSTTASCIWSYTNVARLDYYLFGQLQYKTASFPFNVIAWSQNQCLSLTPLNGTVILLENWEADAKFRCDASNWAQTNIKVDCWNSQILSSFGSTFTATCHYDDNDLWTHEVKCLVGSETVANNNCRQTIIVDQWMLWYCGNWIREWYEKCDLWWTATQRDNWIPIHNYLDNNWLNAGNYANNGYRCENCTIKKQWFYEAVACWWISTTLSVQKWEVLPFRRELEGNNIVNRSNCNGVANGKILKDSLRCVFKIFNWNNNQQYDGNPTFSIEKDCDVDERWTDNMFQYFKDHADDIFYSLQHAFGKYYFIANNSNNGFLRNETYGEYKLVLDKVRYDYCDGNNQKQWTEVDRICEVNFAVTKPYLMQKSLFWVTPKATTDIGLDKFYDMKWDKLIKSTDLSSIMKVDANDYAWWAKMDKQITDFVNKYTKLSIKIATNDLHTIAAWWTITEIRKVPSQQIYIIKWTGKLTLKQLNAYFSAPFTMIVKWMDLIIEWSVKTNWMFVVQWWKISFKEDPANRCKSTQTVQWIFISNQWFWVWDTTLNLANDLDKPRCNYGWLNVKWVLIWDNITNLVLQRRSQLNDRFWVHSNDVNQIKIERRNKIFNWASVLIEYSPALRWALPPWASDFTKVLDVYKK